MPNALNVNLKICGITSTHSIVTASQNNIRSLGFASDNLLGPNTCNDKVIKNLIKECDYYKIESVLLSRNKTLLELVKQIDYTKPKTISCSYFYKKSNLIALKSIFKKLKIGIAVNPETFDLNYFKSIRSLVNVFYYDLNVYKKNQIKTYSLNDCLKQIKALKKLQCYVYIGGGINYKNALEIINNANPHGLDVSRSLKDNNNNISTTKLNELLLSLSAV